MMQNVDDDDDTQPDPPVRRTVMTAAEWRQRELARPRPTNTAALDRFVTKLARSPVATPDDEVA